MTSKTSGNNDISTVNSTTHVVYDLSPEQIRNTRLLAAKHAVDEAEAQEFYSALGLSDDEEE